MDRLLHKHPELKEKFHFVQIGKRQAARTSPRTATSREEVQALGGENQLGARHRSAWQPVVFLNEHHGPEDIFVLYRACRRVAS